jgi:ubiquinone/menaquinone biosynthesis C-methylase UbiE
MARSTVGEILRGYFRRGLFPGQLAFVLKLPLRRLILAPRTLADRLHLREDARVLELGPGSGYFSPTVARRLPRGGLHLCDLQAGMLWRTRRTLQEDDLQAAGCVQADARALPYRGASFDVAFLVAVLGEVPAPAACLRDLHRVLRPGGLLSITEQPGDPDFLPLPTVRALAEGQAFTFQESYGRGKNYTANFTTPA